MSWPWFPFWLFVSILFLSFTNFIPHGVQFGAWRTPTSTVVADHAREWLRGIDPDDTFARIQLVQTTPLLRRQNVRDGDQLRMLPLGDSITFGYRSSDGNGYRLDLENQLANAGSTVQYVGSVRSGNMTDNSNEGHPGYTIKQIAAITENTLHLRPNVVLLMAGTNDMNLSPPPDAYDQAPDRLGALLDEVLCICPDAVVLVAKLTHAQDPTVDARIQTFNAMIPDVIAARRNQGFKVWVVDMSVVTKQYLSDGLHPNDEGYDLMAKVWFQGLQQVSTQDWITTPQPADQDSSVNVQSCRDEESFLISDE